MTPFPPERIRHANNRPERSGRDFVLYWMQACQRAEQNWALTAAIQAANRLRLPVVVHHELNCASPWANDRLHRFALEGIAELGPRFARRGIRYHFSLRQRDADTADLLDPLARRAALVVTDDFPALPVSDATRQAAERVDVALWAVDGNGIVPLAAIPGEQYGAYTLRPRIHRLLPAHLRPVPEPAPLCDATDLPLDLPELRVTAESIASLIAGCAIDHGVPPSLEYRGGLTAARARLRRFLAGPLRRYAEARNRPGAETTSRLSPYLHLGQISVQEVALAVRTAAGVAAPHRNAFLEELIVRRELAYNFCRYSPHHRTLKALPSWARETLRAHARDPRPYRYSQAEFEGARTHDYLWNAIQAELLVTGLMFGYYRMYWGKKIIEWTRTPAEAQAIMLGLHERYALDGRDPNTYANVLWCLGKHDRPWAERPVFGKVRTMSLAGMETKTDVRGYLDRVNRWCREAGRQDLAVTAPATLPRTKGATHGTR